MSRILATLMFALLLTQAACAEATRLKPVDQAAKDPSFKSFRDQLLENARRRDADFVLSIVDGKIINGFSGNDGVANFKKIWKPESPSSPLYDVLIRMLSLGGTFTHVDGERQFCAPYVFSAFPQDMDAIENMAVIADGVPLMAGPSSSAKTVARLSYDIVWVDYARSVPVKGSPGKYTWYRVKRPDGRTGFVQSRYLRSPLDYRAYFARVDGRWKMRVLVAGD